jgi:hypothetical protein
MLTLFKSAQNSKFFTTDNELFPGKIFPFRRSFIQFLNINNQFAGKRLMEGNNEETRTMQHYIVETNTDEAVKR